MDNKGSVVRYAGLQDRDVGERNNGISVTYVLVNKNNQNDVQYYTENGESVWFDQNHNLDLNNYGCKEIWISCDNF